MEKFITKSYLLEVIKEPITLPQIHNKIIKDFNIRDSRFNLRKIKELFDLSNINLRSKPRLKTKIKKEEYVS